MIYWLETQVCNLIEEKTDTTLTMIASKLNFKAHCKTTAMAIMPHSGFNKALDMVLSLDIPFWP